MAATSGLKQHAGSSAHVQQFFYYCPSSRTRLLASGCWYSILYAENLTTYSSRYSKNFSFYPFISYLALLKSFRIKCVFNFQTFLTVLFYDFFLENGTLYFSFTSQEFITVETFEISFTTTEI